jgi:TM2 domain-containing membrane protein YozV
MPPAEHVPYSGEMADIHYSPSRPFRDVGIAYLLWFFLGILGGHRYYLRRFGTAILYTLTMGLFGIGWFVDLFLIPYVTREVNKDIAVGL